MAQEYRVISSDSHLELPPDSWSPRVPAKWRDRAPRRIQLPDGADAVLIENRPLHRVQATRFAGMLADDQAPTYVGNPGWGGPDQRVREQDRDGIDAEILFTHPQYPDFWRAIPDDDVYLALIHAYNEYLAEDYFACAPDRLVAMGVIAFNEQWGLPLLERRPSEYLRTQNSWGFLVDVVGVQQRDVVGVDKLMWGSDFPHSATDWPNSRRAIEQNFAGVPEAERHLMLSGNAARFFHMG